MAVLRSVCVYCGSSPGHAASYLKAAREFGTLLGSNKLRLVYGGGGTGMMGEVARSAITAGGQVTGVIPDFLKRKELLLDSVQDKIVVPDMHERKMTMFRRADAFVALPGGIGTLEEVVEQMTWAQLGRHHKPIALVNVDGFFDPLRVLIQHMRDEGFIRQTLAVQYLMIDRVEDVLPALSKAIADMPQEALGDEDNARIAKL